MGIFVWLVIVLWKFNFFEEVILFKNIDDLENILIKKKRIGFDLDYTIIKLESTFDKAEKIHEKYSEAYWNEIYNAPVYDYILNLDLIGLINRLNKKVVFITDRPDYESRKYLTAILKSLIKPKCKVYYNYRKKYLNNKKYEIIKKLRLDFYLGDSDNDVRQVVKAGLPPYRMKRYHNNYTKGYNPNIDTDIIFDIPF